MIALKKSAQQQKTTPVRRPSGCCQPSGSCDGLTMIEVLLALAIFSIGLIAVAGMQMSSVTRNTASRMNTMAVEYASDYMERLLGLGIDSAILTNGNNDDPVDDGGNPEIDEPDEVLAYPHLAAGGPHRPGDFAATDFDNDGEVDIPVSQEFNTIFDLSWTINDFDLTYPPSPSGVYPADPGRAKQITLRVSWSNGWREIVLSSIKATAL